MKSSYIVLNIGFNCMFLINFQKFFIYWCILTLKNDVLYLSSLISQGLHLGPVENREHKYSYLFSRMMIFEQVF